MSVIINRSGVTMNGRVHINRVGGTTTTTSSSTSTTTTLGASVLIGYVQASPTPSFIDDCSTTFTSVLCTVPIYMPTTTPILGVNFVYSLGQLPTEAIFSAGVPFYTDAALTTPLPQQGGRVYGFNANLNGVPNRQIRISNTTPQDYNGYSYCTRANYGYYVVSGTKVNVGSSTRALTPDDDSLIPYVGQRMWKTDGSGIGTNTTIAWAASPNVTATHLITFGPTSTSTVISVA